MPNEMRIMGRKGDTRVTWNARDTDEVSNAKRTFDDLRAKRFLAFSVTETGGKGEQMDEFNPDAQKVIMVPPMAGGAGVEEVALARDLTNDEVVAGTLEWVNAVRGEYGLALLEGLPSGIRGSAGECAVALALSDVNDRSCVVGNASRYMGPDDPDFRGDRMARARFSREGQVVTLFPPQVVGEFVCRFDEGVITL